ncbi:MAG: hypothetical protein HY819_14925 [Acidobacteria bacterium]|nr:hypothetical protein [Acidobacteriota bacterium]
MFLKKSFFNLIILILALTLSNIVLAQSGVRPNPQNTFPSTITITEGTSAKLELETPISSKLNEVGDEVIARLSNSIIVDGIVVLRRGTEFRGRISQISPAKRPQRQATLAITFDKVVTQFQEQEVSVLIRAIDDFANESKLNANDEGKIKGGRSGRDTVDNINRGVILSGGAAPIIWVTAGPLAGATAPLGGALAGVLFSKGNDIKLFPGTLLRVEINKPLIVKIKDDEIPLEKSSDLKSQSSELNTTNKGPE